MKINHDNKEVELEMCNFGQALPGKGEFEVIHNEIWPRIINSLATDEQILATSDDEHEVGDAKKDSDYVIGFRESAEDGVADAVITLGAKIAVTSCRERKTIFRIDKPLLKKLSGLKVSPKIIDSDWLGRFFHLSDSYCFEFDNQFSFNLSFLNRRTTSKDGYQIYLGGIKDDVIQRMDNAFRLFAMPESKEEFTKTTVTQDGLGVETLLGKHGEQLEAYWNMVHSVAKNKRREMHRLIGGQFSAGLSDRLVFQYYHNDPSDGKQISSAVSFSPKARENAKNSETVEDFAKKIFSDRTSSHSNQKVNRIDGLNWLLVCLQMLEFSHKQSFVTNNKTFTTNMRKSAKGMSRKKETASYKALTAEKIIELPRKVFLNYTRGKSKGNHVSPEGHNRVAHPRTYRHSRYVNMRNKTVTIKSSKINGGAAEGSEVRKTVYEPKSGSGMVKDFVKSLEEAYRRLKKRIKGSRITCEKKSLKSPKKL